MLARDRAGCAAAVEFRRSATSQSVAKRCAGSTRDGAQRRQRSSRRPRRDEQRRDDRANTERILRRDVEQQRREPAAGRRARRASPSRRRRITTRKPSRTMSRTTSRDLRAERDAHAHLVRALRDAVRDDAVQTNRREHQREPAEHREHRRAEPPRARLPARGCRRTACATTYDGSRHQRAAARAEPPRSASPRRRRVGRRCSPSFSRILRDREVRIGSRRSTPSCADLNVLGDRRPRSRHGIVSALELEALADRDPRSATAACAIASLTTTTSAAPVAIVGRECRGRAGCACPSSRNSSATRTATMKSPKTSRRIDARRRTARSLYVDENGTVITSDRILDAGIAQRALDQRSSQRDMLRASRASRRACASSTQSKLVGVVAEVQRLNVLQTAHEQSRADEQHDRERRLQHEQRGAHARALAVPLARPGLERRRDVRASRLKDRRESSEQSRRERASRRRTAATRAVGERVVPLDLRR